MTKIVHSMKEKVKQYRNSVMNIVCLCNIFYIVTIKSHLIQNCKKLTLEPNKKKPHGKLLFNLTLKLQQNCLPAKWMLIPIQIVLENFVQMSQKN